MKHPQRRFFPWFVVVVLLAGVHALPATAEDEERQRVTQDGVVRANGDIELTHTVRLPLRSYNTLKRQVKNTQMLLRRLGVHGQADIYKDARAEYDDEAHSVRVTATVVGGMRNAGKRWWTPVANPENQEVLDLEERRITLLSVIEQDGQADQLVTTRLRFPEGTRGLRWNAKRGRVECELPAVPSDPAGAVDLVADVEVRDEVMSCLYKLYGRPQFRQLWIARATFRNGGTATATDFRVRYRIVNYADWSPWQVCPRLQPGQTAVEPYYPIFDHKIRALTAETPSVLEVEWSYAGPDGKRVSASDTHRITLLGMNHVIYSSMPTTDVVLWDELFDNAPLLAATFISHTDPIVQQFAGMAAKVSRGAAAGVDDESALRYIHAIYALMVHNRIAYQWPPGLFKRGVRQHVKYGRDVLRNRAGTCIDLSVLFASTCEAGGLASYLAIVPGHAFPVVKLPSGKLLPIESTGISIRKDGGAFTFAEALEAGDAVLRKFMAAGTYLLCDVHALRAAGVPPPELPELPPGTLQAWRIEAPDGLPATPATPPEDGKLQRTPDGVAALRLPAHWTVEMQPGEFKAIDPEHGGFTLLKWWPRVAPSLDAFAKALKASAPKDAGEGFRFTKEQPGELAGLPCHVLGATRDIGGEEHRVMFVLLQTKHADLMLLMMAATESFQQHGQELGAIVDSLQVDPTAKPGAGLEAPNDLFGTSPKAKPPSLPREHRDPKGRFRIAVPAGWEFLQVGDAGIRIRSADSQGVAVFQFAPSRYPDAAAYAAGIARSLQEGAAGRKRTTEIGRRSKGIVPGTSTPFVSITAIHKYADRVEREEWICMVTPELQFSLAFSSPAQAWDAYKAGFAEVFAGLRVGAPAQPKRPPSKAPPAAAVPLAAVRDAAGLYELPVPRGWAVSKSPGRLSVQSPDGNALVDVTWLRRDGREHATFVEQAKSKLATSFTRWKVTKTEVGTLQGHPVARLVAEADLTGTQAHADVYLLSTPGMHWMLLMACPPERKRSLGAAFVQVAKGWRMRDPEALPKLALREVSAPTQRFRVHAPTNWRVEVQGAGLVARAPDGDAFFACRVAAKEHETIDAYGQAVLDRMKGRASAFRVTKQQVREVEGHPVLHALVEDTVGGVAWVREVIVAFDGEHALAFVRGSRADTAFKWASHLARIGESWAPRRP